MDVCMGLFVVAIIVLAIFLFALFMSDGDLTLMFYSRFLPRTESLAGKVVWITGASSGIGRALAVKLASCKCRLIISARRTTELNNVKDQCIAVGLKDEDVLVLVLDITDISRHLESLEKIINHFGKLDILVNNAGRSQRAKFEDVDVQVDRDLFELNVFSQLSLTTTVLREHFLKRKAGHVVVTSSLAGKAAVPMSRSYTGSKHALHGYFSCLAVEQPSIDVTMLCPGPVVSEILQHAFTATQNETYDQKHNLNAKRMSADRCAHLSAVAIANKLDEAWICIQPILMMFYGAQYFPSLSLWLLRKIGVQYLNKQREGDT